MTRLWSAECVSARDVRSLVCVTCVDIIQITNRKVRERMDSLLNIESGYSMQRFCTTRISNSVGCRVFLLASYETNHIEKHILLDKS